MAIAIQDEYPGQVDTGDPAYPYGRPRNEDVEGDGTGTPWEASLVKDLQGFLQALLVAGRITPNGTPDNANASQYLLAIARSIQLLNVLDWEQPQQFGTNLLPFDPATSGGGITLALNGYNNANDAAMYSADGGNTWASVLTISGTGVLFRAVAADPASAKAIITGSKGGGTDIQVTSALGSLPIGGFTAITPGGTPTSLASALFDPVTSRFIVTGKTGTAPYIATAELADLTTWTQRTVPASITGSKESEGLARIGNTIVASWDDQTKTAYSTDGGATWTASTTSLTSGKYVVVAGETAFLAIDRTSQRVYKSTDGITWTAQPNFVRDVLDFARYGLQFLGGVFVFRAGTSNYFYYSTDYGATWVKVLNTNFTWASFGIVRNRLLSFSYLTSGPNINLYTERSRAMSMPAGVI